MSYRPIACDEVQVPRAVWYWRVPETKGCSKSLFNDFNYVHTRGYGLYFSYTDPAYFHLYLLQQDENTDPNKEPT